MRVPVWLIALGTLPLAAACRSRPQSAPSEIPSHIDVAILHRLPSYRRFEGCPPAAQAVITRFGLPADSVHQCLSQRFVLGRPDTVALAHIAFGEPPDCMVGCSYQHLCAIVDRHEILPFAYHFLAQTAPWIGPGAISSHHAPQYLTGRRHRLVRDSSFQAFYHAIIRGGWEGVPRSAWAYCTDGLPLDMSSDVRLKPQN